MEIEYLSRKSAELRSDDCKCESEKFLSLSTICRAFLRIAGVATAAQTRRSSKVARKDGMHSTTGTLQNANNETSINSSPEDSCKDGDAGSSTAVLTSIQLSFFEIDLLALFVTAEVDGERSRWEAHNVIVHVEITSHGLDIDTDGQNC